MLKDRLKDLMSINELAEYLSRPKPTIYYWVCKKLIPYYKPTGKHLYFSKTEIDAWIKGNRIPTDAELDQKTNDMIVNKG